MSQLDVSIFYSHLFGLLLVLYIFSHLTIIIISVYFYNMKLRGIEDNQLGFCSKKVNRVSILLKMFE